MPAQVVKILSSLSVKVIFERLHCIQYSLRKLEYLKDSFGKAPKTLKELSAIRNTTAGVLQSDPIFHLWKLGNSIYGNFEESKKTFCGSKYSYELIDMKDTLLSDLKIRLNCPYPYIHCEECEHFIVIQQARLINEDFDRELLDSPFGYLELVKQKERKKICRICDYYFADWIVKDDRLSPDNYLCHQCLESLHYGEDQKIVDDNFFIIPYLGE